MNKHRPAQPVPLDSDVRRFLRVLISPRAHPAWPPRFASRRTQKGSRTSSRRLYGSTLKGPAISRKDTGTVFDRPA